VNNNCHYAVELPQLASCASWLIPLMKQNILEKAKCISPMVGKSVKSQLLPSSCWAMISYATVIQSFLIVCQKGTYNQC